MALAQDQVSSVQRHCRFIDMILFLSLRHVVWNHFRYTENNAFKHSFTSVIEQNCIIILIILMMPMMMTIIIALVILIIIKIIIITMMIIMIMVMMTMIM